MTQLYGNQAIILASDITIDWGTIERIMMLGQRDISFGVYLTGGKTAAAADITADLKFYARHFATNAEILVPFIDITKAGYRADVDQTIGSLGLSSVQSVGNTQTISWVSFDNLNADQIRIVASFSDVPDAATPAKLVLTCRQDNI